MDLPIDLRTGIEYELQGFSPKALAEVANELSTRYRSGHGYGERILLQSQMDIIAYAAYRLPATFAAIYSALVEVRARRPNWQPRNLLDAGSGPGTTMWAATAIWPQLEHVRLLEREEGMITFGKQLAKHALSPVIRQALWQKIDLKGEWDCTPSDFVTAAYVLGELPISKHENFISQLWSNAADTLLIVEPGTPRGFSLIRHAREQLIAAGAIPIAPCPHAQPCPMTTDNWCHFSQRITRTKLHRSLKKATLSYEDEKFSYIVMSKQKSLPIKGRVVRHPQIRGGHIRLEICTPEGLKHSVIAKSNRDAFRQARDLHWGSAVSPLTEF